MANKTRTEGSITDLRFIGFVIVMAWIYFPVVGPHEREFNSLSPSLKGTILKPTVNAELQSKFDTAIQRFQKITAEIGIPIKLTLEDEVSHGKVYFWLRDELGLKDKFAQIPPAVRNPIHIATIDTHPDDDDGVGLDEGNWVIHLLRDFNRDHAISVRIGLLTRSVVPPNNPDHFKDGIWNSPMEWPRYWKGCVTLDLDYTVGYMRRADPGKIHAMLEEIVAAWAGQEVGILALHVDRGYTGEEMAPIALDALAEAMEKHKRALMRSRLRALLTEWGQPFGDIEEVKKLIHKLRREEVLTAQETKELPWKTSLLSAIRHDRKRVIYYLKEMIRFFAQRDSLPERVDWQLILGGNDLGVVKGAWEVYQHYQKKGVTPKVIISGGVGLRPGFGLQLLERYITFLEEQKIPKEEWSKKWILEGELTTDREGNPVLPEAVVFRNVLRVLGMKGEILIEPNSINTGENVQNTRELLSQEGITLEPETIFLLHQLPLLQVRSGAIFKKQFGLPVQSFSYAPYLPIVEEMSDEELVELLGFAIGEKQRLEQYPFPPWEFMEAVQIPKEALETHEELMKLFPEELRTELMERFGLKKPVQDRQPKDEKKEEKAEEIFKKYASSPSGNDSDLASVFFNLKDSLSWLPYLSEDKRDQLFTQLVNLWYFYHQQSQDWLTDWILSEVPRANWEEEHHWLVRINRILLWWVKAGFVHKGTVLKNMIQLKPFAQGSTFSQGAFIATYLHLFFLVEKEMDLDEGRKEELHKEIIQILTQSDQNEFLEAFNYLNLSLGASWIPLLDRLLAGSQSESLRKTFTVFQLFKQANQFPPVSSSPRTTLSPGTPIYYSVGYRRDGRGDVVIAWEIAQHLKQQYPSNPIFLILDPDAAKKWMKEVEPEFNPEEMEQAVHGIQIFQCSLNTRLKKSHELERILNDISNSSSKYVLIKHLNDSPVASYKKENTLFVNDFDLPLWTRDSLGQRESLTMGFSPSAVGLIDQTKSYNGPALNRLFPEERRQLLDEIGTRTIPEELRKEGIENFYWAVSYLHSLKGLENYIVNLIKWRATSQLKQPVLLFDFTPDESDYNYLPSSLHEIKGVYLLDRRTRAPEIDRQSIKNSSVLLIRMPWQKLEIYNKLLMTADIPPKLHTGVSSTYLFMRGIPFFLEREIYVSERSWRGLEESAFEISGEYFYGEDDLSNIGLEKLIRHNQTLLQRIRQSRHTWDLSDILFAWINFHLTQRLPWGEEIETQQTLELAL